MSSEDLRKKYIEFFKSKGHTQIPSASLVPENDSTTLFISAGMQPLVPYLLGALHPAGKRLVNFQKCVRTGDIDEVGDTFHHTFFEMLGNWSLGDYFKEDSIKWSYEFLTQELDIAPERIKVSVFAGNDEAVKDEESAQIWRSLGIPEDKIMYLGKEDNWWATGITGPCGPDTEIFVDGVEIWNNVFMAFNRKADGSLEELPRKNVDTGMGLERALAVLNGSDDNYQTDLFAPIIQKITEVTAKRYSEQTKWIRRIADHTKAATFIITEGVEPSNVGRGYVLRRLLRRSMRYLHKLGAGISTISQIAQTTIDKYSLIYPELSQNNPQILAILEKEQHKFTEPINDLEIYRQDLEVAFKNQIIKKIGSIPILLSPNVASGQYVFENYQTYGVPPDLAEEIVYELGLEFDKSGLEKALNEHQHKSRTASSGMFKGGLVHHSETTTKLHTATHLLQQALRLVLGEHVSQKGSNITEERLRFDLSHPEKLTNEQIKEVENLVNQKIIENIPVTVETMNKEEALNSGARAFFAEKYGDQVTVYTIGEFSQEICGGPHVKQTGEVGSFKITKEEAVSAGVRRIYATVS